MNWTAVNMSYVFDAERIARGVQAYQRYGMHEKADKVYRNAIQYCIDNRQFDELLN